MARIDDFIDNYLLEHNEKSYVRKRKVKRYFFIILVVSILIFLVKPLTRIKSAYIEKLSNYSSTHKEAKKLNQILESNKEISYASKYPVPIKNGIITNHYGNGHTGVDIQGVHRSNITSIEDGKVTFAGVQQGYGNCVEIKHIDENGNIFYSFYAHLYEIHVAVNDEVEMFDVIGKEGGEPNSDPNSGNSTGHHLHFEIRTASGYGNDVNPEEYIF